MSVASNGQLGKGNGEHSEPLPSSPSIDENALEMQIGTPINRSTFAHTEKKNITLKNRRFSDLNSYKAKFIDCDFSYSIFERAYFRSSVFENCKFTGCRFYDSNFRGARFYGCDLKYATFHRTLIEPKEVVAVLPPEPNLRRDLLQNLRANAVEVGDYGAQHLYVINEINSRREHLRRAMSGSESYYRDKYSGVLKKSVAGIEYLGLILSGAVWGHGERPFRLIVSAAVFIILLSLINIWSVLPRASWESTRNGVNIILYSFETFLDANPDEKFRGFSIVDYVLITMRYIYIGLFISVLMKWISHR